MNRFFSLRSLLCASLGAFALVCATACSPIVSVGGGSSNVNTGGSATGTGTGGDTGGTGGVVTGTGGDIGGTGGTGGAVGGTGGGTGGSATFDGVGMTREQFNAIVNDGSGGSASGTGGGPDLDPQDEFLFYGQGTQYPVCSAPFGTGGCGGWTVSLTIAPGLFHPGILPFSSPDVDFMFSVSNPEDGSGTCSGGGGGGFDQGQVEILEITDTTVHFIVSDAYAFDFEPNGEFTVARCGGLL